MRNNLTLRGYYGIVACIYAVILCVIAITVPGVLAFPVPSDHILLIGGTYVATFTILFLFKPRSFRHLQLRKLVNGMKYAVIFALPEEVIFRGVIQGFLENKMDQVYAILVSAGIYGLAHALNGATGIFPSGWNWRLCGLTFLLGLPLGFLFSVTGTLLASTILHLSVLAIVKISEKQFSRR